MRAWMRTLFVAVLWVALEWLLRANGLLLPFAALVVGGNLLGVRARIYIRVSTDDQARNGVSLEAQEDACRAFARSQGWTVADIYREEGASAKDMARPHLKRLLSEMERGEIVVVYRLDRLTRSVIDLHTLLRRWDAEGVLFRSVTEVYDTTTAMGRLFITLVAAMAQWERENLAERVQVSMLKMAKQGRRTNGVAPKFGYRFTAKPGDDGKPSFVAEIHEEEAALIRRVDALYTGGYGLRKTAVATGLTQSRVCAILYDESYTGTWYYNRTSQAGRYRRNDPGDWISVPGALPAIRSAETQARINAIRTAKRAFGQSDGVPGRAAGSPHILAGLLRCGHCGAIMVRVHPARNRPGRRVYYRCARYTREGGCVQNRIRADLLEEAVIRYMLSHSTQEVLARQSLESARRTPDVSAIDAALRRLLDGYEAGAITLAEYVKRKAAKEAERAAISTPPAVIDAADVASLANRLAADAQAVLSGGDTAGAKAYLWQHVARVIVTDGDVTVHLRV